MPIINTALTLKDLPSPVPSKTGWPWTEQSQPLPKRMPNGSEWPRISIVTPSYNQGQFIEETIRSVLLQGYPNLEYIIIDGGSTDNSVEIIKKYSQYLTYWVSGPDSGQSSALNKGFRRATGELIGWQNSDDYYHPEAFTYAAKASAELKNTDIIYGTTNFVDTDGIFIRNGHISQFDFLDMLPWANMFNQSMFFGKNIFQNKNFISEEFSHYIDHEFFWRLALSGYKFYCVPEIIAYFRQHSNSKGSTQDWIAAKELLEIYKIAYQHPELPEAVRDKALRCMRSLCLDNYGKCRLSLFRESVRELISLSGFSSVNLEILFKYLVSFLDVNNLETMRNFKKFLRITSLQKV